VTALGAVYPLVTQIDKGIDVGVGYQVDAAAIPTVTAIRSALGHVFLTPEADATATAIPRLDADEGLVHEFHLTIQQGGEAR
jgi:hypothetical protein